MGIILHDHDCESPITCSLISAASLLGRGMSIGIGLALIPPALLLRSVQSGWIYANQFVTLSVEMSIARRQGMTVEQMREKQQVDSDKARAEFIARLNEQKGIYNNDGDDRDA